MKYVYVLFAVLITIPSYGKSVTNTTIIEGKRTFVDSVLFIYWNGSKDERRLLKEEIKKKYFLESSAPELDEITMVQKIRLYGEEKSFCLIEYDFHTGCGAAFPWKTQILMNESGYLIRKFNASRYELLSVLDGENPFLLIVNGRFNGNGNHELFGFKEDELINFLSAGEQGSTMTYGRFSDQMIFQPKELNLRVTDVDLDGNNDLVFTGFILHFKKKMSDDNWYETVIEEQGTVLYSLSNPSNKIPIEIVYIFNAKNKEFILKENYIVKYKLE